MMETTEQTAAACPASCQTPVRTWLPSTTRAAPSDNASRFHGDGVRYKAKLIGVDPVPDAQGHKMCWDSMMKLKGFEAALRKQGKHKQRVWLKVSSSGLRIVDERTAAVLHDHDPSRISSLTKDESDPRALAYVYQHQDSYSLFYIKTANLAEPVLADVREVCWVVDQETPAEAAEAPTQQTDSLLLISDSSVAAAEGAAIEDVFSPRPGSSSGPSDQASSSSELLEVFSNQELLLPDQSSSTSQPESPQPALSASQILSMFPKQPIGGSPYASPPYSPSAVPWAQQGPLGNQWAGATTAPWSVMPRSVAAWAPAGFAPPPACSQVLTHGPQPGGMMGGNTPASPSAINTQPPPLTPVLAPAGASGPGQSVSPTLDYDMLM